MNACALERGIGTAIGCNTCNVFGDCVSYTQESMADSVSCRKIVVKPLGSNKRNEMLPHSTGNY